MLSMFLGSLIAGLIIIIPLFDGRLFIKKFQRYHPKPPLYSGSNSNQEGDVYTDGDTRVIDRSIDGYPSIYKEALSVYNLKTTKLNNTFTERYLHNKILKQKAKDIEDCMPLYLNSTYAEMDNYDDYDIILVIWSAGILGISYKYLTSHSLWSKLQYRLSFIDISQLINPQYLLPNHMESSFSCAPFYLLYLFEGISQTQIRWRKLDTPIKGKLDICLSIILQAIIEGNHQLSRIFLLLSQLQVRLKDFTPNTKKLLKDAFFFLVAAGFPCPDTDFAEFVYAIGNIDYKIVNVNSKLRNRIQSVIVHQGSAAPLKTVWKTLSGLSSLGFVWSDMEVNARFELENILALYGEVPSWKFSPMEIACLLRSMRDVGATTDLLRPETANAILTAVLKVMKRLYPKQLAGTVSNLGALGFEYASMSDSMQMSLASSVSVSVPRMSSWDLVETVLGLGRMKVPSSVLKQSSIFHSLASKSALLGAFPTAELLLGLGLLTSHNIDIDNDVVFLAQSLSKKWSPKMPKSEFIKVCIGVSFLSSSQAIISSASSKPISFDSLIKIGVVNSLNSAHFLKLNSTSHAPSKISPEWLFALDNLDSNSFFAYLSTLPKFGINWRLLKHRELTRNVEERFAFELQFEQKSMTKDLSSLRIFSEAVIALDLSWDNLSDSFQARITSAVENLWSKLDKHSGDSFWLNDFVSIFWALGYMKAQIPVPFSILNKVLLTSTALETVKILLSLGCLGWRWFNITNREIDNEIHLLNSRGIEDENQLVNIFHSRLEWSLSSSSFYVVCIGLNRVNFHEGLSSQSFRVALLSYIPTLDLSSMHFGETVFSLARMGFLNLVDEEERAIIITKIGDAIDESTDYSLLFMLKSLLYFKAESSAEQLYVAKRLFLSAIASGKIGVQVDITTFANLLEALGDVYSSLSKQLGDESEDVEVLNALMASIEDSRLLAFKELQIIFDAIIYLGIPWEHMSHTSKAVLQSSIDREWEFLTDENRERLTASVGGIEAWDIILPYEVVPSLSIDIENWQTIGDLEIAIRELPTYRIPDILLFSSRKKIKIHTLIKSGIWSSVLNRIEMCRGDNLPWNPVSIKLPMLLNAFDKLFVKDSDFSEGALKSFQLCLTKALAYIPARSVSNCLYYACKLKFILNPEVKRAGRTAFFRTCLFMNGGEGEFANAVWALPHLSLVWDSFSEDEIEKVTEAFLRNSGNMNSRDFATTVGALRTLGATWDFIPLSIREIVLEKFADVAESMDKTSLSLSLFSLGVMGLHWDNISIVVKAVIQEKLPHYLDQFSEKECYWVFAGLGMMKYSCNAANSDAVDALHGIAKISFGSPNLKAEQIIKVVNSLAIVFDSWGSLPIILQENVLTAVKINLSSLSSSIVLQILERFSVLQLSWASLSGRFRESICFRLELAGWITKKNYALRTLFAFLGLGAIRQTLPPKFFVQTIRAAIYSLKYLTDEDLPRLIGVMNAYGCMRNELSPTEITQIATASFIFIQKSSLTASLKLLRDLKSIQFKADDLDPGCVVLLTNLAVRYSTLNKDNRLLHLFASMGASISSKSISQLDIHKKAILDHTLINIKLIDSLRKRLPLLSDEDFLRVIYLLGQKRFPKELLISGDILDTIDIRMGGMFSELSPGVIIAVLSSLNRLGLNKSNIPKTTEILVTEVSSLACTLDTRTFLISMRALADLGFTWDSLSNDQRLGIVAGVARSASANPSKLPAILTALIKFKANWKNIHEKIPIVLRYVVYKIFSSIGSSPSLIDAERASTIAFVENLLRLLCDMEANWEYIGDKACITLLQALSVLKLTREEQLITFPFITNLFGDIPNRVFEAVPIEFRFLFHIKQSDYEGTQLGPH